MATKDRTRGRTHWVDGESRLKKNLMWSPGAVPTKVVEKRARRSAIVTSRVAQRATTPNGHTDARGNHTYIKQDDIVSPIRREEFNDAFKTGGVFISSCELFVCPVDTLDGGKILLVHRFITMNCIKVLPVGTLFIACGDITTTTKSGITQSVSAFIADEMLVVPQKFSFLSPLNVETEEERGGEEE